MSLHPVQTFFSLSALEKQGTDETLLRCLKFVSLYFFLFTSPCLNFPSPSRSHNHINIYSFILAVISQRHTEGNSLGLGDEQCVGEQEEVSVLGLQACLQLCLSMAQELTAWTLSQEGLDKGTGLGADWCQAAFPGGQNQETQTMRYTIDPQRTNEWSGCVKACFCCDVMWFIGCGWSQIQVSFIFITIPQICLKGFPGWPNKYHEMLNK